ncbi:MAG: hypothetical protein M3R51_10830 [Candidatus Eremiobacteraeota bacterium]|nr:hypothetical protein [Candidatus Eremiobacteraeota bacterium]
MRYTRRIGFAATALVVGLGACQGGFSGGGTASPVNPPVNQVAPGALNPTTEPSPSISPQASSGPQDATFSFASGPKGLACPQQNGFSCTLYLNMSDAQYAALLATPSPLPSGRGKKPTPTPSPTPTPTESPSPGGSLSPSPSPSPGAQVKLTLASLPKDAPAMVNPDKKALATVSLLSLRLSATDDIAISGHQSLQFTLPKEQIGGRGFAIQLFHETTGKHNKRSDQFIGSYSQSSLKDTTLIFRFTSPKISVKKGETWLFMLYGDELPSASESPQTSGSPSASATPAAKSPASSASPQAAVSPSTFP